MLRSRSLPRVQVGAEARNLGRGYGWRGTLPRPSTTRAHRSGGCGDRPIGIHGLVVYTEVALGKTIIGKDRRLDILILRRSDQRSLALECKYQKVSGSADEKILYALQDLAAIRSLGLRNPRIRERSIGLSCLCHSRAASGR